MLPTSDSEKTQAVSVDQPYLHLIKNKDLLISSGAFFEHKVVKHTNNFGYYSDEDYEENGLSENLITIGSSLVTANQVSNKDSFHGLINAELKAGKKMLMFAGSNAPQSQYLAYTKFALDKFNPYAFVIIIGNLDFKSSLLENSLPNSGFHYYENMNDNSTLILNEYKPSKTKEFLRNFAIARYLYLNVKIQNLNFLNFEKNLYYNNSNILPDSNSDSDNHKLMNRFLKDLKKITKNIPVLLVIDSEGQNNRSEYLKFNNTQSPNKKYFIDTASHYDFEIIDLEKNFLNDFKINQKRFEWTNDAHWNEDGHRVVANAIKNSKIYKKYYNNSNKN